MHIYIPTYGRSAQQTTFHALPKSLQAKTKLVVQARESGLYGGYPTLVLPDHIQTITPTRQWIMERHKSGDVVMLDDDLRFFRRRKDDPEKFREVSEQDMLELFDTIEKHLKAYAHVGVLAREGGNRITKWAVESTRMMRVLAYDAKVFHAVGVRFDRLPLQEDFDVTLQLLRSGYANTVLCDWVQNQGGSGSKGGCSHFRTIEMHNKNAEELARLHAPFVKVVEKQTKGAWSGQPRKDVVVRWKDAYNSHFKGADNGDNLKKRK